MKIEILTSAYNDLKKGRIFYEAHAENLGDYFLVPYSYIPVIKNKKTESALKVKNLNIPPRHLCRPHLPFTGVKFFIF